MSWNGLGNEGALSLGDCLKNNSILFEMDITSNRITQDGAAAIAKGLDVNETLKVFKVEMIITTNINGFYTVNCTCVYKIFKCKLADVDSLQMGKNPIGTAGALIILNAINNERSVIQELDLTVDLYAY